MYNCFFNLQAPCMVRIRTNAVYVGGLLYYQDIGGRSLSYLELFRAMSLMQTKGVKDIMTTFLANVRVSMIIYCFTALVLDKVFILTLFIPGCN